MGSTGKEKKVIIYVPVEIIPSDMVYGSFSIAGNEMPDELHTGVLNLPNDQDHSQS